MPYRCPKCGEPLARTALDTLLVCSHCRVGYLQSDLEGYPLPVVEATPPPPRRAARPMGAGLPIAIAALSLVAILASRAVIAVREGGALMALRPTRTPGLRPITTQTHRGLWAGPGTLTVDNGTSDDGFVRLAPSAESPAVAAGSVRAGDTLRLEGIPDGDYVVWYCTGSDWRPATHDFAVDYRCRRFEDRAHFSTRATSGGWTYSTWEITLHSVPDGNAETRYADPEDLPPLP